MAYSKEKQQKLVSSLTSIGALAGDNNIGVAGGIKGLEMSLEQSKCDEQAKSVRDGLFKVAIMGTFSSGKSTVINALIGSNVLPESAMPCTAILTFIQYGTNEDRADVYMADEILSDGSVKSGECVQMSVKDFQNVYKYTLEDEITFKETGTVPRFAKVKYAIMYCSKPLMEGGVSIIDSPGLEDKAIATELALQIAQEAQAIIYVATEKGYGGPDKEYIESTFHNCPNNVFFVINKFDLVKKEERPSSLEKAKLDLASVFTDQNGFNEELCNRRVFGISALRALDSRRGLTYDKDLETEVPLDETQKTKKFEMSWFGPFEKELETFLTTDERCIAQYQKCFNQMASTYRNADKQIADYITILENEIQMDADKKAECAKLIADIESSIKLTETTFDNCSLQIQNCISSLLTGCGNEIEASWEQDMIELEGKTGIGIGIYLKTAITQLNPLVSKEDKKKKMEKMFEPMGEALVEHFKTKIQNYFDRQKEVLDGVVEECQNKLNTSIANTDELLTELAKKINPRAPKEVAGGDKNWIQILISTYLGDINKIFDNATSGKYNWIDFFKKTIVNTIWQSFLYALTGGPGAILILIIEYFQMLRSKEEMLKKSMETMKTSIVKGIKDNLNNGVKVVNKNIAGEISNRKTEGCKASRLKLHDEQARMRNIESSLADNNFNLNEEKNRFNKILESIFLQAKEAYSVVFTKELTLPQFKQF